MSLDNIIELTITVQDTPVTKVGFGLPLVMDYHTNWAERYRLYSSTTAMVTDGFAADDPAVLAVGAILSQNPKISQVAIGRRDGATDMDILFTPVAQDNTDYAITINGTEFSIDSGVAATPTTIATALFTAINAGSEPVTAVDNTGSLNVGADVAGVLFSYVVNDRALFTIDDETADATVATDYATIKAVFNDFYGVLLTSKATLEITALAAAVEADRKLFGAASQDDDIPADTGGNLGETLDTAGYNRTYLIYHPKASLQHPEAAWMGERFPSDPGTSTWKFKTLAGVDFTVLTDTELNNLGFTEVPGIHVNHYTRVGGVSIMQEGWASSGRFIDITRFIDWLHARIQESLFGVLVNVEKVPQTDEGIALVQNAIEGPLKLGVKRGGLAADPAPLVTAPKIADVPANDKTNRLLPDITFTARLAGAFHKIQIVGTVSV
jgi:hypothetical protein